MGAGIARALAGEGANVAVGDVNVAAADAVAAALRDDGHSAVLVVPVQFLADHLEILFDIDVAAAEEAEEAGLAFNRTELPNTDPAFIESLRQVVERERRRVR